MKRLDVKVKLYRYGVSVDFGGSDNNGSGGAAVENDESTAVLGKAKLGKMKLGNA